jgi:hypothetical protein
MMRGKIETALILTRTKTLVFFHDVFLIRM